MKNLFVSSVLLLCFWLPGQSQFLPGIGTSNYNGVLGTFSNPSNALGQYKWDVHLFGIGALAANQNAKLKLGDIGSDNFVSDKLIGEKGYNSGIVNLDIPALSVLVGFGKKTSFALSTRARVFANASDVNAEVFNALADNSNNDPQYPYTFTPGHPSLIVASGITEYGFTWANEILNNGPHYLKGGITAKYVSGVGNISFNTNLSGKIDEDITGVFISPGAGSIAIRTGGAAFVDNFSVKELFTFNGGGLGLDLGLTYEYRPQTGTNVNNGKKQKRSSGNIPYQFKFSASLMDIGKVNFNPDTSYSKAYAVHIPTNKKFYLSEFDGTDVGNASDVFDKYPQYFTNTGVTSNRYKVNLPTTLRLNFDYNIGKGFFVNLDAQIGMKSENSIDVIRTYNVFSITPRYEGRMLGIFLPVSVHPLSGLNVGAAFHAGPLYIGSGSILSLLVGGSKQADAFFGFRFGGLKSKNASAKEAQVNNL